MSSTLSLTAEKRRAPRMPVDWGLRLRLTGEDESVPAKALNVSKGGVAVHTGRSLAVDEVAKLVLSLGDDQPEVHAYAHVAWARQEDGEAAAGLRFFGIREQDEARIAGLVERWLLAGGARPRSRN